MTALTAPARAEGVSLSPERQAYLEGVWSGLSTEVSADQLCSQQTPPPDARALSIEFMRSGGVAFADDGSEAVSRGPITEASEENGIVSLTFGNEVWRLGPDGPNIMYRVRSSASLGGGRRPGARGARCALAGIQSGLLFDVTDEGGPQRSAARTAREIPGTGASCEAGSPDQTS